MAVANLALSFLLELVGVAALAWWGWQAVDSFPLRLVLAILAGGALVVVWGLVAAPRATNRLSQDHRSLIGAGLLLVAAGALALAGQPVAAAVFAVVIVLNQVLVRVLGRGGLEV